MKRHIALLIAFASLWLLSAAGGALAEQSEAFTYLRAGTEQVGNVRHLCLIYHGNKKRLEWTAETIMPYVAYLNKNGEPKDWMFDSFLFIEFVNDSGAWFHHYRSDAKQVNAKDWAWLADCWFREKTGLIGLEGAVAKAGQRLGNNEHLVNVVITMPIPLRPVRDFGLLPGLDSKLDFSSQTHRQQALKWYIDKVLENFKAAKYQHLRLAGFYWTDEAIPHSNHDIVKAISRYLHGKGLKLYWIPYFVAQGLSNWRELGIDVTMLQPNYFFKDKIPHRRLGKAAMRANIYGCGIEIEFNHRLLTSQQYRNRLWDYLDAGAKYGWMNNSILGYYDGGGCLKKLAENAGENRDLYDALYRFIKGTYKPSGRVKLAELNRTERDNRENLALASKGAKITGCVRNEHRPDLLPENIIDGNFTRYGGVDGYGFLHIPGSFTIELPETAMVARTETLLWDLDDRLFRYRIETSLDNLNWQLAVDKSQTDCRGWQVDTFTARRARYVRLTGLANSENRNFQVVEFEIYPPLSSRRSITRHESPAASG